MGLILDSSVIIAAERRGDTPEQLVHRVLTFAGDQEAALSANGLTELVHGIYRAQTPAVREQRERFVGEIIATLTVYPFTSRIALLAGKIDGEQAARGVALPFADLLIGATAPSLGFSVLTLNPRHFRLIPGLPIMELALA